MKQCQICKSTDLKCFIGPPHMRFYICTSCNNEHRLYPEQMWLPIEAEETIDKEHTQKE